jgi:hypothetical protein
MHSQRVVVVSASGAGMLATFLPWISLGPIQVAGTQGIGWFSFGFFVVAMLVALTEDRACYMSTDYLFVIEVVAMLAAILGVYGICHVYYADSGQKPILNLGLVIGPGLFLVVGAALVLMVTASLGKSWLLIAFPFVVTIIVGFAGAVHVPYGDHLREPALCWKWGWSLEDTFPDIDKLVGRHVTESNAKVMNALFDCGVLKEIIDRKPTLAPVKTYGYCTFDGRDGICMSVEQCTGIHRPGFCTGADNIQCCVQ